MSDAPRIKYKYRASATFNSNLLLWTLKDLWVFYSRYISLFHFEGPFIHILSIHYGEKLQAW